MRGQAAVELVVILAVSLLVLFVIISLSSQYLAELTSSKIIAEARNSVEDLAAAAKQVYYQGEGARQKVFITIPEGVNSSKSGVGNRTITINTLGTDVLASTEFDVRGRIPTTPGGYTVWVTAKKGYVLKGTLSLSAEPSTLLLHFFSENYTQSSQNSVVFKNDGESTIDVELKLNFPSGDVNASFTNPTDTSFLLLPDESKEVLLDFRIGEDSFGSYSGVLHANASNEDELEVDIIVDVTSQICTTQACPPSGAACTPHYAVIETYNDSSYTSYKEIFDPSEYVSISGAGWELSSQITLDIKEPGGFSVVGYPKLVDTDSGGRFSEQWNTAGAAAGEYTVRANYSTKQRSSKFNITVCT